MPRREELRQIHDLEHVVIGKSCNFAATCSKRQSPHGRQRAVRGTGAPCPCRSPRQICPGMTKPQKSALIFAARCPGFSRSTAVITLEAPRAISRSLAKASVRPDSRISSTSITSRSWIGDSMSRKTSTCPDDTCGRPVARQNHEIHFRRKARMMHGADQIRRKDEAAFQAPEPPAGSSAFAPRFRGRARLCVLQFPLPRTGPKCGGRRW